MPFVVLNQLRQLAEQCGLTLESTAIVGVQHVLAQILPLASVLRDVGLRDHRGFLVGKIYSTTQSVADRLHSEFQNIDLFEGDEEAYSKDLPFSDHFKKNVSANWDRAERELFSSIENGEVTTLLILDDGGNAIVEAIRRLNIAFRGERGESSDSERFWKLCHEKKCRLAAVEQTSAGVQLIIDYLKSNRAERLTLPIILLASCALKKVLESKLIAEHFIEKFDPVFGEQIQEASAGQSFCLGMIGAGSIGNAVQTAMVQKYGTKIKIAVYDKNPLQENQVPKFVQDRLTLVSHEARCPPLETIRLSDVTMGCTGKDVFKEVTDGELAHFFGNLDRDVKLVSSSSENIEFYSLIHWLKEQPGYHAPSQLLGDIQYQHPQVTNGKMVTIYYRGCPFNFRNATDPLTDRASGIHPHRFQMMIGALLGGLIQAQGEALEQSGVQDEREKVRKAFFHQLDANLQQLILEQAFRTGGLKVGEYPRSKMIIFDTKGQIWANSFYLKQKSSMGVPSSSGYGIDGDHIPEFYKGRNEYYELVRAFVGLCEGAVQGIAFHRYGGTAHSYPLRNGEFYGRNQDLTDLTQSLMTDDGHINQVVVCGPRGVGKTQIVREYLYRHEASYPIMWWFDCGSFQVAEKNKEKILDSFQELARRLEISPERSLVVSVVKEELRSRKGWLLVFDGASDVQDITPFLPYEDSQGHVLITSHYMDWRGKKIDVRPFIPEEARGYCQRALADCPHVSASEEIIQLADFEFLKRFPLALTQAVSYIKTRHCSIKQYLHEFKVLWDADDKLADDGKLPTVYDGYSRTVRTAVMLTINEIKRHSYGKIAISLLNMASCLSASGITSSLLESWASLGDEGGLDWRSGQKELLDYRLLEEEQPLSGSHEAIYSMHPLTQMVIRDSLDSNERSKLTDKAADAMLKIESTIGDRSIPGEKRVNIILREMPLLLPHCIAMLENSLPSSPKEAEILAKEVTVHCIRAGSKVFLPILLNLPGIPVSLQSFNRDCSRVDPLECLQRAITKYVEGRGDREEKIGVLLYLSGGTLAQFSAFPGVKEARCYALKQACCLALEEIGSMDEMRLLRRKLSQCADVTRREVEGELTQYTQYRNKVGMLCQCASEFCKLPDQGNVDGEMMAIFENFERALDAFDTIDSGVFFCIGRGYQNRFLQSGNSADQGRTLYYYRNALRSYLHASLFMNTEGLLRPEVCTILFGLAKMGADSLEKYGVTAEQLYRQACAIRDRERSEEAYCQLANPGGKKSLPTVAVDLSFLCGFIDRFVFGDDELEKWGIDRLSDQQRIHHIDAIVRRRNAYEHYRGERLLEAEQRFQELISDPAVFDNAGANYHTLSCVYSCLSAKESIDPSKRNWWLQRAESCFKSSVRLMINVGNLTAYANFLFSSGCYEEAVPVLLQVVDVEGSSSLIFWNIDKTNWKEVLPTIIDRFGGTVEIDSKLLAHWLLIQVYERMGSHEDAGKAWANFSEFVEKNPSYLSYYFLSLASQQSGRDEHVPRLREQSEKRLSEECPQNLRKADIAYAEGSLEAAIKYYEMVTRLSTQPPPRAHHNLGCCYQASRDFTLAGEQFKKAIELGSYPSLHAEYAVMLYELQNWREAISQLEIALGLLDDHHDDTEIYYGVFKQSFLPEELRPVGHGAANPLIMGCELLAYYLMIRCHQQLPDKTQEELKAQQDYLNRFEAFAASHDEYFSLVHRMLAYIYREFGREDQANLSVALALSREESLPREADLLSDGVNGVREMSSTMASLLEILRLESRTKSIADEPHESSDAMYDIEIVSVSETKKTGSRMIPGWELEDVPVGGDSFYYAVVDQLKLIKHPFLQQAHYMTQALDNLRARIKGRDFYDGEFADYPEIFELVKQFELIVAIVSTRYPQKGFRYFYSGVNGPVETIHEADLPSNVSTVRMAFTGEHYMSVRKAPGDSRPIKPYPAYDIRGFLFSGAIFWRMSQEDQKWSKERRDEQAYASNSPPVFLR